MTQSHEASPNPAASTLAVLAAHDVAPSAPRLASKMSSSYPPPPTRRRLPPEPKPEPDTKSTLYSSSPHHKLDAKARKARHYTDPTWALLTLLALALIYWSWPGVEKPWTPRSNKGTSSVPACNCQQSVATMPWQSTFTLSSPGKGCHLVTNEVSKHIAEGLKGTKVGILHLFIQHTSAGLSISEYTSSFRPLFALT